MNSDFLTSDHRGAELHTVKSDSGRNQLDVPFLLSILTTHSRFIVLCTGGITIAVMLWLLLLPNRYSSRATILPSGQSETVSSLKDLVGLGAITASDENSSALFPLILRSRSVKDSLMRTTFRFRHEGGDTSLTLPVYFEESDPDKLLQALDAITSIETGRRTGEIAVAVETTFPGLSQEILQGYLTLLEDYNLNRRQSTGRNNQLYLARQLSTTSTELQQAELELTRFRASNRDWAGSSDPEIVAELTRLQRQAEIKSTALLYLQQQYEVARFNAQKDVPIVRLLDSPSLPSMKSGPFRAKLVIMTFLGALAGSILLTLTWHLLLTTYPQLSAKRVTGKTGLGRFMPKLLLRRRSEEAEKPVEQDYQEAER